MFLICIYSIKNKPSLVEQIKRDRERTKVGIKVLILQLFIIFLTFNCSKTVWHSCCCCGWWRWAEDDAVVVDVVVVVDVDTEDWDNKASVSSIDTTNLSKPLPILVTKEEVPTSISMLARWWWSTLAVCCVFFSWLPENEEGAVDEDVCVYAEVLLLIMVSWLVWWAPVTDAPSTVITTELLASRTEASRTKSVNKEGQQWE